MSSFDKSKMKRKKTRRTMRKKATRTTRKKRRMTKAPRWERALVCVSR